MLRKKEKKKGGGRGNLKIKLWKKNVKVKPIKLKIFVKRKYK